MYRGPGGSRRNMVNVTLEDLLRAFDATEANLAKLEAVWVKAESLLPKGPSAGTSREYEAVRRQWKTIASSMPPLDGWRFEADLPDADTIGREFWAMADIGEPAVDAWQARDRPGIDLDEYRHRLARARSRAVRSRLDELTSQVDGLLPQITAGVNRYSGNVLRTPACNEVRTAINEIERLVGSTVARGGRWSDLWRHLSFGEGHDWHDIMEWDWPDVKAQIDRLLLSADEPLVVPDIDLGVASRTNPTGGVATRLGWTSLSPEEFERVLFNILLALDGYQNVEWVMNTNAADRGRDISAERVIPDAGGETRTERVLVQAKHWQSRSLATKDVSDCLVSIPLWEPPPVHCLIIATSGSFTQDAVTLIEKRKHDNQQPRIEMWAKGRLESLLAQKPAIIAEFGLASDL